MQRPTTTSEPLWNFATPELQALISTLVEQNDALQRRVDDLEARLNLNSTNSSRPPSTDPPGFKRAPPPKPSGRKRGGQPGHRRHERALVPPGQLQAVIDHLPQMRRGPQRS